MNDHLRRKPDHTLDTSGLLCPEPLMLLHNVVRDAASGDVIEVIATDPSTERDIPKFCAFLEHKLIVHVREEDKFIYQITKA